jgi:hypothetical protein
MGSVYVGNGTDEDWLEGYIACESHLQLSAESRQLESCHYRSTSTVGLATGRMHKRAMYVSSVRM